MTALALLLLAIGVMLIHAATSGKDLGDIIRGFANIKSGAEPSLKVVQK